MMANGFLNQSLAGRLFPISAFKLLAVACTLVMILSGCGNKEGPPSEGIATNVEAMLQEAVALHSQAEGLEPGTRAPQLEKAADLYQRVLQSAAEGSSRAQALRSLGQVRALQGQVDLAVQHYADVEKRFPDEIWEIVQAWKGAGDLLWESGRTNEGAKYYNQIVRRHSGTNEPMIVRQIVAGARQRLEGKPGAN